MIARLKQLGKLYINWNVFWIGFAAGALGQALFISAIIVGFFR